MTFIYILELLGVLVFAISGVLTAVEKKFDIVGATIIGFVTAIGGGTVRDLLIGETPVGWLQDPYLLLVILCAVPLCFFFTPTIYKLRRGTFIFDTIGLGLFTVMGMEKALQSGLTPIFAILMGVVSAVFGGVIRDVLVNREPLIFREEIYASACLAGAVCNYGLSFIIDLPYLVMSISVTVVFLIRFFAVKRNWAIPYTPIHMKKGEK